MGVTTISAADPPSGLRLTAPIEHITELPDGTLLAHVVVTSERPDSQGEIVDYDAFKAAAPDLMKWAVLSEMHDPKRDDAGTILRLYLDDDARRAEADIHVVDPVAARKVRNRVYKAVSIGGEKLATRLERIGSEVYRRLTQIRTDELSLVPRGANPDAAIAKRLVLAKRDTSTEVRMDATLEAAAASGGTTIPLPDGELVVGPEGITKRDAPPETLAKATLELPDGMSLDSLREAISAALTDSGFAQQPNCWVRDVLPDTVIYSNGGNGEFFSVAWSIDSDAKVTVSGTPIAVRNTSEWTPLEKRDMGEVGGESVDRDKLPAAVFAGPNRSYPVTNQASFDDAVSALGRAKGGAPARAKIKAKLLSIARSKGYTLPDSWKDGGMAKADEPAEGEDKPAFEGARPPFGSKKAMRKQVKLAKAQIRAAKEAKAAERTLAKAAKLAKKNKALAAATDALESVGEAMAEEAKEQSKGEDETTDLAALRTADEALHDFQAAESAEPEEDDMEMDKTATKGARKTLRKQLRAARETIAMARSLRKIERAERIGKRLVKRAAKSDTTLAKAGARHSAGDLGHIDAIHKSVMALGYDKCMAKMEMGGAQPDTTPETADAAGTAQAAPPDTGAMSVSSSTMAKADTTPDAPVAFQLREVLAELMPQVSEQVAASVEAKVGQRFSENESRLAKMEKRPTNGGPSRFGTFDENGNWHPIEDRRDPTLAKSDALVAAAALLPDGDPLKADIGRRAAVEETKQILRGQ